MLIRGKRHTRKPAARRRQPPIRHLSICLFPKIPTIVLKRAIFQPSSSTQDATLAASLLSQERVMTICNPLLKKLALSAVLLSLPLSAAQALEANKVGDRLKAALAGQGMDVSWTNLTENGSQIVLEGATVKVANTPTPVTIGNVTLDEVTEVDGGYRIGKVSLPSYALSDQGLNIDIAGAELAGLSLPPEGSTDPLASLMMYETADLATVSVKQGDKQLFSMSNLHVEITPPADGSPIEFSGAAESFTADLTTVEDPASKKVIEALGYNTINGDFEMAGSWQPSDGRMGLTQYDVSIENAGTLGMTFDLGGYTPDFVKAMQDMQKKMAEQPAGSDQSAQGLAMLGLMQQLTFHGATIRFDDDSLTGKVLDYVAKQQGIKPEDIANQAKAVVPFLMAQLNNAELTKNVTEAVNAYLDDPQSLEIKAAPASPVPFALVMAGAMSTPKDLPKTLGVTVTANEGSE
jgi:hypothetical protein